MIFGPVLVNSKDTMRKISILLFTISTILSANGQVIDGVHDKLFDQFLLGKYEDCYYRAIKMTESERYKSDPEPYLYVSMCCVKLLEDADLAEANPNALKDALKYADKAKKYHAKAMKKDIPTFPMGENLEFFDELTQIAVDEAKYYYYEDKYSKSASWFKKLYKIRPNDDNVGFAMGANMLLARNAEGKKILDALLPAMTEKYKNGDAEPAEASRDALVVGFLAYTKYLMELGESGKAKDIITFGHELMPDNNKITAKFEEITM